MMSEDFINYGLREIQEASIPNHWISFVEEQYHRLLSLPKRRPWYYWELHNPWGRSAHIFDSWQFLDLLKSEEIIEWLSPFLGSDIILFESRFYPDLYESFTKGDFFHSDADYFPVEPLKGITVRISIPSQTGKGSTFQFIPGSHITDDTNGIHQSIDLEQPTILVYDSQLSYRIMPGSSDQISPGILVRYFPSDTQYIRDHAHPVHRLLTDRIPLLNYAHLPLWQVSGVDRANNDFVTGFSNKSGRWI